MELINREKFGVDKENHERYLYHLENENIKVSVLDMGGIIQTLKVKDKNDQFIDIVLGYDTLVDYQQQTGYVGAIIGRNANRLSNGRFSIKGKEYQVTTNEGQNQLHGGTLGFDKKIWNISYIENGLQLQIISKDKEEGYPGNLQVTINYRLEKNKFIIEYIANSDKDTICNLTNHSYFNLSGHEENHLEDHTIQIIADYYNPTDHESIILGTSEKIEGTPFDFRQEKGMTKDIKIKHEQLIKAQGYDHNYEIKGYNKEMNLCAIVKSKKTGIKMKQYTNMQGVQFYTGNYVDENPKGKNGTIYHKQGAFCLETQYVPNAINKINFDTPILEKGIEKTWKTVFEFDVF